MGGAGDALAFPRRDRHHEGRGGRDNLVDRPRKGGRFSEMIAEAAREGIAAIGRGDYIEIRSAEDEAALWDRIWSQAKDKAARLREADGKRRPEAAE